MSEFLPTNEAIISETPKEPIAADQEAQADETQPPVINGDVKRKKKRGSFGILKAALLILRKSSGTTPGEGKEKKKSLTKNGSSVKTKWTKLVGSMRPLHMQETANTPPRAVAEQHPQQQQQQQQQQEAIVIAPASPAPSSSCGTISTYASASSLRDLYSDIEDEEEEEEDPDQVFDAICGDEMIDAKAEEFIAQFYKQIRLQNSTTAHHHHHRRN